MMRYGFAIVLLLLSIRGQAEVTVTFESQRLFVDTLVGMRVDVWDNDAPVDLSPLWQRFELVDQTTGSFYRVVDGMPTQVRTWALNVRPRDVGTINVPAVIAGDEVSSRFDVHIFERPTEQWTPPANALRAYWRSETVTPYVQQVNFITLVIEHDYPLSHLDITWPDFAGVRAIPHGDTRYLRKGNQRTIERTWAIIGEQVGPWQIAPVGIRAQLNRSRIEHAVVETKTQAISFTIRDIPSAYKARWFLPAYNVAMEDHWSANPAELVVGERRTRTITVRAEGVFADQIPELSIIPSRGVETRVARPAQRETTWIDGRPHATVTFTYEIEARTPIPVFFDNVRLHWFSLADDAPRQTLIYALRADIANPPLEVLLANAPPLTHHAYGWRDALSLVILLIAGFVLVLFDQRGGMPSRFQRILAGLKLWWVQRLPQNTSASRTQFMKTLYAWFDRWEVVDFDDARTSTDFKAGIDAVLAAQYARHAPDVPVISVLALDRWCKKRTLERMPLE